MIESCSELQADVFCHLSGDCGEVNMYVLIKRILNNENCTRSGLEYSLYFTQRNIEVGKVL